MANKQGEGKIDWCNFTWNPVSGVCGYDCEYCYMKGIRRRFPEVHDHPPRMNYKELMWNPPEDAKVFVCSSLDLFHPDIPNEWIAQVINAAIDNPQATYQFLTKNAARYAGFKFPQNCWLGTTVDGLLHTRRNLYYIRELDVPNIKFVSFEPLKAYPMSEWQIADVDWIIIGADSRRGAEKPRQRWADCLRAIAGNNDTAVWIKDNYKYPQTIKEWPVKKVHALQGQAFMETHCWGCQLYERCDCPGITPAMIEDDMCPAMIERSDNGLNKI